MKKIRKAVVPVAGYGTRFLPATKSMPKEMLPIVDKPVVQYVVEELVAAGIEQIIFVTSWHKRAIEDHFDRHLELENKLEHAGKTEQLDQIKKVSELAEFVYVRQPGALGTGDAILRAKDIVGNEPFVVCWGDEILSGNPLKTKQLIDAYGRYGGVIFAAKKTDNPDDADRYGFASGEEIDEGIIEIEELIEKPGLEKKPSNLAVINGYVFPPEIFEALENVRTEPGAELLHIDGVNALRKQGVSAYAVEIKNAKYYDCGNVTEYLKTNVEMALTRDDLKDEFAKFIKETASKL